MRAEPAVIALYLEGIHAEARFWGYKFDKNKIGPTQKAEQIPVTAGQMAYEWEWLLEKLKTRNAELYHDTEDQKCILSSPCVLVALSHGSGVREREA